MTNDWQTWGALAVVFLTAAIMIYRAFVRKKTGCGGGCGCDTVKGKTAPSLKRGSAARPDAR